MGVSARSHSSRFALVVIRGVRRLGRGVVWISLSSCDQGGRGSVPVFLIGLTGGMRQQECAVLSSSFLFIFTGAGSCSWQDDIDMGRIKGTMREAIDNEKNVIAAGAMDGGRDAERDDETRRMEREGGDETRERNDDDECSHMILLLRFFTKPFRFSYQA